jgi:hypothetical protein
MRKLIYYIYLPFGIFHFLISLPLVIILVLIMKFLIEMTKVENDTPNLGEFIPYWFYLHTDYDHIRESIKTKIK